MSTLYMGGASVSARTTTPSVNLSRLCEMLAQVLADEPGKLARYDQGRLHVDLYEALRRLYKRPAFASDFAPAQDTGFLCDLELPPRGTSAKMGGRLLPGTEGKTTASVEKLCQAIETELDAILPSGGMSSLVSSTASQALKDMAAHLGVNLPIPPKTASIVPVGFAAQARKAPDRENDVARVLTAIETVEGRDWLDRLLDGIKNWLKQGDLDDDEIDPILNSIRRQKEQPGSQIRRYLEFLDDEALSRVRLQVTFKLMEAVAAHSNKPGLQAYVKNVLRCVQAYASLKGKALQLDPSIAYGLRSNGNLADYLRKATFYYCLPTWAEWSVQIFEARTDPEQGFATKREVSYRFRVNGNNPETGKSAFATRLDRIEEKLLGVPSPSVNVGRSIAELAFLRLVTPDSLTSPTTEDAEALAMRIAAEIKSSPVEAIRKLIDELRDRESTMAGIAKALIEVIQSKSAKLVSDANRIADKFYIAVNEGVVDWVSLRAMSSKSTEILVKNEAGSDNIAWFQHLTITDAPSQARALASYWVETRLMERSIAPTGVKREVEMSRNLDMPVLPVRFIPFVPSEKAGNNRVPADAMATAFDAGCGVDVEYDVRSLSMRKGTQDSDKAKQEQLRTAGCAAFALLTYLTLWVLARKLHAAAGHENLAMYLIRLQPGGKESESTDGNAAVYAICQAIERALSREMLVKMQGFHTQGKTETVRFRKTNSLLALQGSFPLATEFKGDLDKAAVLSYATRPCDTHPLYPDADGYLFTSRAFCADRVEDKMVLRIDPMQSRFVDNRKAFREPELILEEIARLYASGYQHIVLLSHHYGNRHIGRAAERHSPHGTHEFIESACSRFPDVCLYPLRRDVFPATRLHTRTASESSFEMVAFADHQSMYDQAERDLLRGLQPIYTFATLAVVSEEGRPQSGFCTYFFDVEQRLSNLEWAERIRQNILGLSPATKPIRASILGVLRGIHYLESERAATKNQVLPVLDPFGWAAPGTAAGAGELEVIRRRGKGSVLLSFPALLAHVTKVLHKDKEPQ